MSHTPGPWSVCFGGTERDDGFSIESMNANASRIKVTCECWPCTIVDGEHRREMSDNSRLIAAAPDMLNALRAAQFAMTNQRYNLPRIGMEREYRLVADAIAKATGEPQPPEPVSSEPIPHSTIGETGVIQKGSHDCIHQQQPD